MCLSVCLAAFQCSKTLHFSGASWLRIALLGGERASLLGEQETWQEAGQFRANLGEVCEKSLPEKFARKVCQKSLPERFGLLAG